MTESCQTSNERTTRCVEWLKTQNNPKKLSLQNKNDIQFIIETNAHRKKFFLTAEDDATVPAGVDEVELEPINVPVRRLRTERLCFECEWPTCRTFFANYIVFQVHVATHIKDVHVIEKDGVVEYVCLWDVCGHKTTDKYQVVRHINYHAYHGRLLAIGFNARASLKLERCKKDSRKRNVLPPLTGDHCCMWYECKEYFTSMQDFLDHVKVHADQLSLKELLCSWAGCGQTFTHRGRFNAHIRSHTGERLIACYHCGQHFALNRKLSDHLLRQNVDPQAGHQCSICARHFASAYLLGEHVRRHVSCCACALCDMSLPSQAALAAHVRYRHMRAAHVRVHQCHTCEYKAKTKDDLKKHTKIHTRKTKRGESDSDSDCEPKKKKDPKEYICHMCPDSKRTVFTRGTRLTTHLVKVHGARWPCGHSRFRYQRSEDGMFRLTTTRFEVLEISKKIVDGYQGPKAKLTNKHKFNVRAVAEATANTPKRYEVSLNNTRNTETEEESSDSEERKGLDNGDEDNQENKENEEVIENVEESQPKGAEDNVSLDEDNFLVIEMCDVDGEGNVIKKEVLESKIVYA